MAFLLHAGFLLIHTSPGFLNVGLHLSELPATFIISSAAVLFDFLDLSLFLYHELLPHRKLLLFEGLTRASEIAAILLDLQLGLFKPAYKGPSKVTHHLLEIWITLIGQTRTAGA